jgi:hypothetical protein
MDGNLRLTDREIHAAFTADPWAERFPPVLSLAQAADLLQVPMATIYAWSSRGYFKGCARHVGKHVRIFRDRLLQKIFNESLSDG